MRDLLIVGLDVHNGEMAEIVERINASEPTWALRGFISPDGSGVGGQFNGYPVHDATAVTDRFPNAALAPNEYAWSRALPVPRERYVTLVDPSAWVSRSARLGVGCVVYPHCFIGLNAVLGDFVFCLGGAILNHDARLGDGVVVTSGVRLAGEVEVGAGAYLGQACTVRQRLKVGARSLIGMGAVVVRDVPPDSVMVGNPARRLRARHEGEV